MAGIERYYEANRSLLLDCQIIVTSLRFAGDANRTDGLADAEEQPTPEALQ